MKTTWNYSRRLLPFFLCMLLSVFGNNAQTLPFRLSKENLIAIEILDSEGNRLYGSIDKAGDYTLYVSVYVRGESDRRNLGK